MMLLSGKEMDADISDGYIHNLWVHGNAVYYNVYEKVSDIKIWTKSRKKLM